MRIAHIMKPNHKCETPQRAMWVSLHTHVTYRSAKETRHELDFGILLAGRRNSKTGAWTTRSHRFENARGFWKLLDRIPESKTRTYIIVDDPSRTLALLDVFTSAYKKGWENTCAIISNPPTIVRWRREDVSIVMLAYSQLWGKLSDAIKIGSNGEPSTSGLPATAESAAELRMLHAVTTMQSSTTAWWDFLLKNDLGGFSTTLGTQALRVFRHRFMTHPIMIDNNRPALQLARSGYHGGRTECHQIGKLEGEFYLLDVNSMYAAVMRDMLVPTRLICHSQRVTLDDVAHWITDRVVIAECEVETEEPIYAYRKDDSLLFPIGAFVTTLSANEVVYACRQRHIKRVLRASCYDGFYCFRAFVQSIWDERRAAILCGRTLDADRWKKLLASFYGKWGQAGGTWETIDEAPNAKIKSWQNIDYETGEVTEYRQFGGIIQQRVESEESSQSLPAIAASITANARVVLWQMMCEAGRENVYYVDTDSLLVNAAGLSKLESYIQPDTLGGLRLEGTFGNINIRASKDYVFGERTRLKGIPANSVVLNDGDYIATHAQSLAAMFRGGDMSKATDRRVKKHLARTYNKGIVETDGRVTPLRFKVDTQ